MAQEMHPEKQFRAQFMLFIRPRIMGDFSCEDSKDADPRRI